jgi:hypothetical protein
MMNRFLGISAAVTCTALALVASSALPASGQTLKKEIPGFQQEEFDQIFSDYAAQMAASRPQFGSGRVRPTDVPDIFGPGSVLTVGNLFMKVPNFGFVGNPFIQLSSDPSGQWPGSSGIEYLNFLGLNVGAVNNFATDPKAVRRVSSTTEWRPPTIELEDRLYRAYDGIINGARFSNDDGDFDDEGQQLIDEDFLDGRDNDADDLIDEDHAALGQQVYSCVLRDDTDEAVNVARNEKHIPLGLRAEQRAWAYSIPGFTDFNVVEWRIINVSGHVLDSLILGVQADMDAGPVDKSDYFQDDFDIPGYPSGEFYMTLVDDSRMQLPHDPDLDDDPGPGALCPEFVFRLHGFAQADDEGDENRTLGTPGILLVDHTIDPLGLSGPSRVGFKMFRSFTFGTPYVQGGNPATDQQRFEMMVGNEGVNQEESNPNFGFIEKEPGDQKGDFTQWASVGPFRNVPDGGAISMTWAVMVAAGTYQDQIRYVADYRNATREERTYVQGTGQPPPLAENYPLLAVALTVQEAFEGIWERREGFPVTSYHGRETSQRLDRGQPPMFMADCRDLALGNQRQVNDREFTWFDFDCNYCTGVYAWSPVQEGLFHKTWNAEAPPPNPNVNVSANYNYSDNPDRVATPSLDGAVLIAWDNLSDVTPDPKSSWFDNRGYQIWKVSGWTRPVGSPGPGENDWSLVGEYRLFNYRNTQTNQVIPDNRLPNGSCPRLLIPNYLVDPVTGRRDTATIDICLNAGDLWDRQSGDIIRPWSVDCIRVPDPFNPDSMVCDSVRGKQIGTVPGIDETRVRYPVGRFRYLDREVKNGFQYFYSVTAFDSTSGGETFGRRSAVEAEGVEPQASVRTGRNVWVVPNPYRGFGQISERPSAWDLTPNATDPTGTHIDFMGLPPGDWTIRIFTISGDLVQIMRNDDPVNASIRSDVEGEDGVSRPGFNRQQDNANDGQARWNLISRNGQDVVSGIYLFAVESSEGTQRGKFVIIR